MEDRTSPLLRVFVYGTLKCDYANHQRYMKGYTSVRKALTFGRIYSGPHGFPVVTAPDRIILAKGTADPEADLATQRRFTRSASISIDPPRHGEKGVVSGELFEFDDPHRLIPLDYLESFTPGTDSLYLRVLAAIFSQQGPVPAWMYIMPTPPRDYVELFHGSWP